jgi:hypothetical protein
MLQSSSIKVRRVVARGSQISNTQNGNLSKSANSAHALVAAKEVPHRAKVQTPHTHMLRPKK